MWSGAPLLVSFEAENGEFALWDTKVEVLALNCLLDLHSSREGLSYVRRRRESTAFSTNPRQPNPACQEMAQECRSSNVPAMSGVVSHEIAIRGTNSS